MNLTEIIIDVLRTEARRELERTMKKSATPTQQGEHLYRVGKLLDAANEIRDQLDSGKRVAEIGQFPEEFVKLRCDEELDRVKWNGGGDYVGNHMGMSRHDWFAGQAIAGLCASGKCYSPIERIADLARSVADCMVATRPGVLSDRELRLFEAQDAGAANLRANCSPDFTDTDGSWEEK